jgi:hypothetical protein
MAANPRLSDSEVGDLSAHLGFEMGSAAALYKFAHEVAAVRPDLGQRLLECLSPAHVQLLQDMHPNSAPTA